MYFLIFSNLKKKEFFSAFLTVTKEHEALELENFDVLMLDE